MYAAKNSTKLCSRTPTVASAVAAAMPRNTAKVTFAPPNRSDNQPPSGRDTEPTRAPTKARPAR